MTKSVSLLAVPALLVATLSLAESPTLPDRRSPESVVSVIRIAASGCDFKALFGLFPPQMRESMASDPDVSRRLDDQRSACLSGSGESAEMMKHLKAMATFAKEMKPVYEQQGLTATYDVRELMQAIGLKPDLIRLIKFDGEWYVTP